MRGDGQESLIVRFKIFQQRNAHDLIGLQSQARQTGAQGRCKAQVLAYSPQYGRQLLHQHTQTRFAFANLFFRSFTLDRQRDLAANRDQEFQVALRVGCFILVVLHHQDANGGGRSAQRRAQPRRRRRADQLHFALRGQLDRKRAAESASRGRCDTRKPCSFAPPVAAAALRQIGQQKTESETFRTTVRTAPRNNSPHTALSSSAW